MPTNTSRPPANRRERRHRELVGLQQAADYCDCSYRTIRRWIAEGRLPAVRVGPRVLKVRLADLDALHKPVGGAA